MAGSRYLTAGFLLYSFARIRGAERPAGKTWLSATIIGGLLLLGGNGGVTISEQFVDTGLAAVVVATVPIYIVLLSWAAGGPRPSRLVALGLVGGFAGVAILLAPSLHLTGVDGKRALGISILLVGSFLWSAGSIYSRRASNAPSPFLASGQQMLCGGTLLLLAGLITREKFTPAMITPVAFWSWIYLVFVGAIIGFSAYIFLLRHCDPAKVSTYAYVNPIVAVILGTLFAGEQFSPRTMLAAAIIIGSVAIVITAEQLKGRTVTPNSPVLAEAE